MPDTQQHGHALIEVLISTLLITMTVALSGASVTAAKQLFIELHHQRLANGLINNLLETLHTVPAAERATLPAATEHACPPGAGCSDQNWLAGRLYTWQQAAQESLPQGEARVEPGPEGLRIALSWQNPTGRLINQSVWLPHAG